MDRLDLIGHFAKLVAAMPQERGGIDKEAEVYLYAALYDELEKIGEVSPILIELLKEAGLLDRLGTLTQRGAQAVGRGAKSAYEKAQLTAGDVMLGEHGHGLAHAMEKAPAASPTKMLMAYAADPHVQKAVVRKARGAKEAVKGSLEALREKVYPVGTLVPAPA